MILGNARFIFPDGIRGGLELIESGGKICGIRERSVPDGVDLRGNYLAPGFIDVHVHGAVGRDTMEATAEAFRAICDYHASGGTTSLLLTTATAPLPDIIAVLEAVRACRREIPRIAGVHVEGPFISKHRPGAQRQDCIRDPDPHAIDQLLEFADVVKRITLAPELTGAAEAIARFHAANIAVSGGHSDAWDDEARGGFEAGMRHVTHTFNCMSSMRRRDGVRVAGLLEFALGEPGITCELIADGHHVSSTLMKMLYRAKRADGTCLVTDATAGAGLPDGSRFTLAGSECVVRGGACRLADGSTLAGSASRMIDLVRTMVREVGVPLHEAVAMATSTAARSSGLKGKGKLEVGCDADLVVLSPELEVLQVFVAGEQVLGSAPLE